MTAAAPDPGENMGKPEVRADARLKVTGAAHYPADVALTRPAYAFLLTSAIAKGRIKSIDMSDARTLPGVLEIMTYENTADDVRDAGFFGEDGQMSTRIRPLSSPRVFHDGQIVAVIVAENFETAREAAYRMKVSYTAERPSATFGAEGTETRLATEVSKRHDEDPKAGDAERAYATAEVRIDAEYSTPTQHHNPIELFTTSCVWSGDELTIYEPSQFVYGLKNGVAKQLGIDPSKVHAVSSYIGGAFGSKGSVTQRTALVAIAAKRVGRPVKLVPTRDQGFTIATYRAETRHHVRLGARKDGKFVAYAHEGWEVTSRPDVYVVGGTTDTAHIYDYGNVSTRVNIVHADRNTPGFMRSPPHVPYVYPLESAIDELAVKLGMDPIELRRRNDTMKDPIAGKPYSSRSLMKCYDQAAQRFGWSRRNPQPKSMRDGAWLVGWGCATALYPTHIGPAAARVRLTHDGKAHVEIASHDIGTGAYTVIGQVAAERLGIPFHAVEVTLGDSQLPPAPVAGGSTTTATACSTVSAACDAIRKKLFPDGKPVPLQAAFEKLGTSTLEQYVEWAPKGSKPDAIKKVQAGSNPFVGGADGDKLMYAFGAEFVEVRVHARTKEIRVPRMVGAFAAGRIMNTRTAHSQLMGGMIWGVSSALHEATELDERAARYINDNLADYLIPVNADIGEVDVILVPEIDTDVNPAGVKGLGELANVGTAAAVANAVYHATGKRIRDLPIRLEKLLDV